MDQRRLSRSERLTFDLICWLLAAVLALFAVAHVAPDHARKMAIMSAALVIAASAFVVTMALVAVRIWSGTMPTIPPVEDGIPDKLKGEPLLLHCPSEGGWHVGVWHDGRWMDRATLTVELYADFYVEPPPPLNDRGELSRPWPTVSRLTLVSLFSLWLVIFLLVLALVTLFQNPGHPARP
jgi:hypothetical protein